MRLLSSVDYWPIHCDILGVLSFKSSGSSRAPVGS